MRILVTGSRATTSADRALVWRKLDEMTVGVPGPIIVVHGACPYGGVDLDAHQWALNDPRAIPEPHPAEHAPGGKILGPERNTRMVSLGADQCVAFPAPDSRGTWDCLRKAVTAGIPTHVYGLRGTQ